MILSYDANLGRMEFSEGTGGSTGWNGRYASSYQSYAMKKIEEEKRIVEEPGLKPD
jgi:hypothetical protein